MIRWARDEARACASVLATTKSTPDRPETIMLLIALPPPPPTPHTTMRGLSSFSCGAFKLIGIPCLSRCARRRRLHPPTAERLARQERFSAGADAATHIRLSQAYRCVKLEASPLWLTPG